MLILMIGSLDILGKTKDYEKINLINWSIVDEINDIISFMLYLVLICDKR